MIAIECFINANGCLLRSMSMLAPRHSGIGRNASPSVMNTTRSGPHRSAANSSAKIGRQEMIALLQSFDDMLAGRLQQDPTSAGEIW